jgi:diacylglycerol kinase (ATP)
MPSIYIIANPTSGHGKALATWPQLEKALINQNWTYIIKWSAYPQHSKKLVKEALQSRPDLLVAMGGDGTVHEVIDAYYQQKDLHTTVVTAFPIGTGNDWARYWHIPHTVDEWVAMIRKNKSFDHDLGHVSYLDFEGMPQQSVFNNVAGMAYDAFVANYVESKKKNSKVNGLVYLFYIFRCIFMYKLQKSIVAYEHQKLEDKFYTINIGVCPYSGGGLQIVPHARPHQGSLAVTAVKPLNKLQVLLFSKEFYSGKMHLHKKVISFHTKQVKVNAVDSNDKILLECDGEVLGQLPATFLILPKAIKICAP